MKKHLWIIGIAGALITILYSAVTYNLLMRNHILQHQDIKVYRNTAWFMIIMYMIMTPLMLWLQMDSLYKKTGGNVGTGTWKRIKDNYQVLWPYKDRLNLFLVQNPVFLYITLLVPILYFCVITATVVLNMIVEWISWKWFELTCWWDDFRLMHL